MLITKNYFDKLKDIDYEKLTADLKERYDYVRELTEDHTTWEFYNADADIKATVDQYLADLSDYLKKHAESPKTTAAEPTEQDAREVAKKLIRTSVGRGDTITLINKSMIGGNNGSEGASVFRNKIHVDKVKGQKVNFTFPLHSIYNELLEEMGKSAPAKPTDIKPAGVEPTRKTRSPQSKPTPTSTRKTRASTSNAQQVERVDEAVRFIKRYAMMHGKTKTDAQILSFLNSLQRAILEKRIRKTSLHAQQIEYIQKNLVKLANEMGRDVEIKVQATVLKEFLEIASSEQVRLSVAYMKRYIGMQGKHIDKEKARRLYKLIASAIDKQKIGKEDPYRERISRLLGSLKTFITKARPTDTLSIHNTVLNGIQQALDGCCTACDTKSKKKGLDGINDMQVQPIAGPADDAIMNSIDFAGIQFETLGFMGKWKNFIGDPVPGFSAMVSAKPKMGKSYLCADLAGYLARHHGETLFVAGEEKLGHTLQQKIEAVKHPCLHVTGKLPTDLSPYDFIVLDSVTRLKLTPDDLRALKAAYPGKSFIYVYQVTKSGKFRGSQEAQHDVDVVIELPEKGRAVQFGRYNQGGELRVFEQDVSEAA